MRDSGDAAFLVDDAPGPTSALPGSDLAVSNGAHVHVGVFCFCLVTLLLALCRLLEDGAKELRMSNSWRRCIQAVALFQLCVNQTEISFVIPFAYDFAGLLRPSASASSTAFLSGVIQAGSPFGMALGVVAAYCICQLRNYKLNRFLMIFVPLIAAAAYVLLGYVLQFHASYGHLEAMVLFVRFVAGFASGLDLLLSSVARDITRADEQVVFSILEYMAMSAGLTLGPFLTSISSASKGTSTAGLYSQEIRASCLVGILYIVVAFLVYLCVPVREDLVCMEDDCEESHQGTSDDGPRWTLLIGSMCIFLGVFSCTGVEVSSSLVLELQYNWDVPAIGFALCAVYVGVIFSCGLFIGFQQYVHDKYLIMLSSLGGVAGCVLIFDNGRSSALNLLFADLLLYPCLTLLVAIVDGYLYVGRKGYISTAGLNLLVYVIDSTARALAAPTVRTAIVAKGRNTYATLQLGLVFTCCLLAAYTCRETHK